MKTTATCGIPGSDGIPPAEQAGGHGRLLRQAILASLLWLLTGPAGSGYSPYAGRDFPTRPFFGDTHLHTAFSMDAGAFGARLTPSGGQEV